MDVSLSKDLLSKPKLSETYIFMKMKGENVKKVKKERTKERKI